MGSVIGTIGNAIKSGANTAVGIAPYASRLLAQRQAQEDADKQTALKNVYAKNTDDRAAAMLKITQENSARAAEGEWEKAEPMSQDDGSTIMAQRNKKTGEYRPAVMGKTPPGAPINAPTASRDFASPNDVSFASASTPNMPPRAPALPMAGDSQDMSGGEVSTPSPVQQVASQEPQAPAPPKPRTLKPYVKPSTTPASTIPGTPEWEVAQRTKAKIGAEFRPPPSATNVYLPSVDPTTGQTVYSVGKNRGDPNITPTTVVKPTAGAGGSGNLPAPMASKVGQAGEMIKKASDLLPMMEGLGVSLGQSASADVAQNGVGVGHMRIPGTKGVGNMLLNNDAGYAQYQAALSPFVLAAAHALSGARINQDQVTQIRQSIEIAPGDLKNPAVVKQKTKNLLDLVNSISGALPGDAMGAQEDQIDAKALSTLEGYGYRRATRKSSGARRGAAPGASAPSGGSGGDPEAAWAAKNPAQKGETFDAYHARYLKSSGGGDDE